MLELMGAWIDLFEVCTDGFELAGWPLSFQAEWSKTRLGTGF